MQTFQIGEHGMAGVTQMRPSGDLVAVGEMLQDGNMLPRLCEFAGAGACAQACQRRASGELTDADRACAEQNITDALAERSINPENFVMVAAVKHEGVDRVGFGDSIDSLGSTRSPEGYTLVPGCQAFFFRPDKDMTPRRHRKLTHAAMRMADCGDVIYEFQDKNGAEVLGISHFGRETMRGPSAYVHEVNGNKVSWAEHVQAQIVGHYGADPSKIKVTVVAAVEGKDFMHHYANDKARDQHYPGWAELGFMQSVGGKEEDYDCLIRYREMIEWQLTQSVQDPSLRLNPAHIDVSQTINTGDVTLGHSSHHWASKGVIKHGRDMYMVGLDRQSYIDARITELEALQSGRRWTINSFGGEMSDDDFDDFMNLTYEGDQEIRRLRDVQQRLRQGDSRDHGDS